MNFEQVLAKLEKSKIVGIQQESREYAFKTLTVFARKDSVKISVRWEGNIDFSSDNQPSFKEAFDNLEDVIGQNPYLNFIPGC